VCATPYAKIIYEQDFTETIFKLLFADTRQRQKRSYDFGASMKDFERDFKGKLFQKFSLKLSLLHVNPVGTFGARCP
jgi:hypothetical protein